ncbi:MAG: hypothetical protein GX640_10565 [Fibrobacter sp.]|nr:hypothetical protein [Fibrobacter sp.]
MGLTREEIEDLAARYISKEEIVDFPTEGDVFCLLARPVPDQNTISDEEGWGFTGYGICIGYTLDEESKPLGKWLWMHFATLNSFPPAVQVLKLQPPHVVKGRFQNAERTHDIRIIKVGTKNIINILPKQEDVNSQKETPREDSNRSDKIVQFRRKSNKS